MPVVPPSRLSRRHLIEGLCLAPLALAVPRRASGAPAVRAARPTDIRIVEVTHAFAGHTYRAPYMFGGRSVDRVTLLDVQVRVRTGGGVESWGFGSMTLGNAWAFPKATQEEGLGAMMALADALRDVTAACDEEGHPLDLWRVLEPAYLKAADTVGRDTEPVQPDPEVVHPRGGESLRRRHPRRLRQGVRREQLRHLLEGAHAAGSRRGISGHSSQASTWITTSRPRRAHVTPVFHSVGASDAIEPADLKVRLDDGLPNTLAEWIARDGLTHFKIKLNGGNDAQDFDRITRVDRVVRTAMQARRVRDWHYMLDFNEGCPDVGYLLGVLRRVREATPDGFARIKYVEQPTSRDLASDRGNVMHEASKLLPVVVDEGLVDLESLLVAREMGYTGRGPQGVQGAEPGDADGGRGAEVRDVPVRAGPHLSRRVADSLGGHRRARPGQRRDRGQRTTVRALGECGVGCEVPGPVHHPRRRDADRAADRPGSWRRASGAPRGMRASRSSCLPRLTRGIGSRTLWSRSRRPSPSRLTHVAAAAWSPWRGGSRRGPARLTSLG